MIVKIAPLGERVTEVNVNEGSTIADVLYVAGISDNGRSIRLNNVDATVETPVLTENSIITLAQNMKGGC